MQADWADKAQLALSKDREDLARAALVEKKKAGDMAEQLKVEIGVLDDALRAYEQDIDKLQNRLREARSRQTAIAARLESAENRVKLRTLLATERVDEAMARFDQLERRVDYAEGRADALSLADGSQTPSLADEIAALAGSDKIDEELEAMKRALGQSPLRRRRADPWTTTQSSSCQRSSSACRGCILHYITKWKTAATLTTGDEAPARRTATSWPAGSMTGWTRSNGSSPPTIPISSPARLMPTARSTTSRCANSIACWPNRTGRSKK